MSRPRLIPVIQISNEDLVKTKKFKVSRYLGDPINAVRIFNEKYVDELLILDISKNRFNKGPNYKFLEKLVNQSFMPISYGGGISNINQVKQIIKIGIEKIILSSSAINRPDFIREIASITGSSSLSICLELKRNKHNNYSLMYESGFKKFKDDPVSFAKKCILNGAGELILYSVDQDGMMNGYEMDLLKKFTKNIKVPIVMMGGAGNLNHFSQAIKSGASAVAAGSFFSFYGKYNAVLLNYPNEKSLDIFYNYISSH